MDIEKAKILDNILKRFSGNITVSWASLREEFKDDMNKYYILENNINFLVGDGILKRDNTLHTLSMTDKGFATMTDPGNLGYYVKAKKERNESRIKYAAFFITIATFLILLYNNFIHSKSTSSSSTPIEKKEVTVPASDTSKGLSKQTIEKSQSHSFDTTMFINKKTFDIQTKDLNTNFVLLTVNSELLDTLDSGGLSNLEFIDFNNDNNKDILVSYIANNPTSYLYLFDPANNKFRFLENFMPFSDGTQLKKFPEFYFSYQRAGCADLNWVSALFKIENFKVIQLGYIDGKGCEDEEQVIEIYKSIDNTEENKTLVEKLPYSKNIPKFEDKWDFIEKYWNKNYSKFK
jgi:hypothetical protein